MANLGAEFIVNTNTTDRLINPKVAALPDGHVMISWSSTDNGTSGVDVWGRVFNADGSPVSDDFQVATTTEGRQYSPSVTALPDDRFLVSWYSYDGGDGSGSCIRARLFNADGSPIADDFIANNTKTGDQYSPTAIVLPDDRFMLTWSSNDDAGYIPNYPDPFFLNYHSYVNIRARLFDADGTPVANDFIPTSIWRLQSEFEPVGTALRNGQIVLLWSVSPAQSYGRILNPDGSPAGNDFLIINGSAVHPAVVALQDGGFVVTWDAWDTIPNTSLHARIFTSAAVSNDIVIDTTSSVAPLDSSLTALPGNRFLVTWVDPDGGDGSHSCIRGCVFNSYGSRVGDEFIVNTTAEGSQTSPAATVLPDGHVLVTWGSFENGDSANPVIRAAELDPNGAGNSVDGTASSDTITGSPFADQLSGLAGDDIIHAGDGKDTLIGGAGADQLDGGVGGDLMYGGAGHDTYVVDNFGDVVIENPNEGFDTVQSTIHYRLPANVEALVLQGKADLQAYGNNLPNTLIGNAGINLLDGGAGADLMQGGDGDDAYFVDDSRDLIIENVNDGADNVYSIANYRLPNNVENLILQGNADLQAYGNAQSNLIYGNGGSNLLDGGGGADCMVGGAGNDAYFVDNPGDVAIENANEGTDNVYSAANYRLPNNVENLILQGNADLQGYGNAQSNLIYGNGGSNLLDGGGGADCMVGGAGNDAYFVDDTSDVIIEYSNEGVDRVSSTAHYRLPANVEHLILEGSANLQGYGNGLVNRIWGNDGNNLLDGGGGGDVITGGAGNDAFVFHAREADGDIVTDFTGNGAAAGDTLRFFGFGTVAQGATFTQIGATDQWQIHSGLDGHNEAIKFSNHATVHVSDYLFF
jgi:Ca2+-binding RTX toxin-like protein